MTNQVYTVLVGGKAGDGVKKLAQVIASSTLQLGYYSFQMDDYQSLIKGGHSFSIVSFGRKPIYGAYLKADLVICLDQLSYDKHIGDLSDNGAIYYNSDEHQNELGYGLALTKLMKEHYSQPSNLSLAGLAIFFAHLGLDMDLMTSIIRRSYKKRQEENLKFAQAVYPLITANADLLSVEPSKANLKLFTGNQAIALGAWASGLDCYFAYPMTPASSILHYFASKSDKLGIRAVHAESELAAANMAIGAVTTGARAAVGSSGGGFALMEEAFSMAGITEAPLLCILSSRPGPATGVSTYTAQEDLMFALSQGHGEFCRVVACPDSIERAFGLSSELLSLAWRFQIPTILLTEKHLSESAMSVALNPDQIQAADCLEHDGSKDYQRYQITTDGISPMLFAPSSQMIKWNSHEHIESGLRTDLAKPIVAMKDKREAKTPLVAAATKSFQTYHVYGTGSKRIFAYGSTALEIREAFKHLDGSYQLVVPIYLEPLPVDELTRYADSPAVVIEHSPRARFSEFLQAKLRLSVKREILKYDGRAFDPIVLAQQIKEAFDA